MSRAIIKTLLYNYLPSSIGKYLSSILRHGGHIGPQSEVFLGLSRPQTVLSGPFQGMKYTSGAVGGAWLPRLLGTYELELHPAITQLVGEPCDVLIDVGSAEGYYAVGLSLKLRPKKTWAFDTDPIANRLVRAMAVANDVDHIVEPAGFCDTECLEEVLQTASYPLLVCDCEGYEKELLDPSKVPSLINSRILVEAHDRERDGPVISTLRNRFAKTHHIETVLTRQRSARDLPSIVTSLIGDGEHVVEAIYEFRVEVTDWLIMRPKGSIST